MNYDKINSLGVDSTMPVNVNGVYNMNNTVSWGFPVRFLKGSLNISSNLAYYKGKQLIGDTAGRIETNNINTLTWGPDVRLDMSPTEKLNLSIHPPLMRKSPCGTQASVSKCFTLTGVN